MIITGIIPARYASTRFPGKPLALINGKPMIRHVYEKSALALDSVFVATDDKRIATAVLDFGGNVILTDPDHRSGTDRCAEALEKLRSDHAIHPDVVINIQGDEPFLQPGQIRQLCGCFDDKSVEIATLIKRIDSRDDLINPNKPKVVISENSNALYFSRAAVPYLRDAIDNNWHKTHTYYKHIGMYGYRAETLLKISKLPQSDIELAESLEQLRWLSNGFMIKTAETEWESLGIDTPDDLENAKFMLKHSKD